MSLAVLALSLGRVIGVDRNMRSKKDRAADIVEDWNSRLHFLISHMKTKIIVRDSHYPRIGSVRADLIQCTTRQNDIEVRRSHSWVTNV